MTVPTYPDDVWYFAYGSNLDIDQKQARTGSIREARRCRLVDYRLAFNKKSQLYGVCANIVPDTAKEVWGVVYRCRPGTLEKMDTHEPGYQQLRVNVDLESGNRLEAITYVAEPEQVCPEGRPKREYAAKIIKGAEHHGLPACYIREIRELVKSP